MLYRLFNFHTILRIHFQKLLNQVHYQCWHLFTKYQIYILDAFSQELKFFICERKFFLIEIIQNYSCTPCIMHLRIRLGTFNLIKDFRCHVSESSTPIRSLTKAPVANSRYIMFIEKNVSWFNISMVQSSFVASSNSSENSTGDMPFLVQIKCITFN
jgi:hypothetical protein